MPWWSQSILFLATAAGIALWQGRAAVCSRHRAWVGRLAWGLAILCLAAAVALLALSWPGAGDN